MKLVIDIYELRTKSSKVIKLIFLFVLIFNRVYSQDWSIYGKKIEFSKEYKKAKTFKSIGKALENPQGIYSLRISINSNAEYKIFEDNYKKFTNLRKLVIYTNSNNLKCSDIKMKINFSNFKYLENLQIVYFNKPELKGLETLNNLKILSVIFCKLDSIPIEIFNVRSLEVLDFSNNKISFLPKTINNLENLKELDIANNCFNTIPSQLQGLKSLMYLSFNNTKAIETPIDSSQLCQNKLAEYPIVLKDMLSLKMVQLDKNNVDTKMKEQLVKDFPKIKFYF